MLSFDFKHSTPNAEIIIKLKTIYTKANVLNKYEDKPAFDQLCAEGCPNYNNKWSCPPFSPSFSHISKNYSEAILLLLYCNLSQFNYIKTEYMKIKASNSILKATSTKLTRFLEEEVNGLALSSGSCRLCNSCNRKKGQECKKPNAVRYSMEALGLNVSLIAQELFNHSLLWYKDKAAPDYSTVVAGVLTNQQLSDNDIGKINQSFLQKEKSQ